MMAFLNAKQPSSFKLETSPPNCEKFILKLTNNFSFNISSTEFIKSFISKFKYSKKWGLLMHL